MNLFLLGLVAPWFTRRLLARRRSAEEEDAPPYEIVLGRTAATMMAIAAVGLVVVGLGNRPVIVSDTQATEANARTIRAWVFDHGSPEMRRNLDTANTVRVSPGFFRTCIASDNRLHFWCFFVDTKADPPTIRRDPDARPNSEAISP